MIDTVIYKQPTRCNSNKFNW